MKYFLESTRKFGNKTRIERQWFEDDIISFVGSLKNDGDGCFKECKFRDGIYCLIDNKYSQVQCKEKAHKELRYAPKGRNSIE